MPCQAELQPAPHTPILAPPNRALHVATASSCFVTLLATVSPVQTHKIALANAQCRARLELHNQHYDYDSIHAQLL